MAERLTDEDLTSIERRHANDYVFKDIWTGEVWIDGGHVHKDIAALLAEVRRLRDKNARLNAELQMERAKMRPAR
jgi:hypothetical protein